VTAKIAEINPRGETVGLEPDPALAAIADAAFEGHGGLSLHVGSLMENALPDAHFDFVYLRFVLQHVPCPLENVRALMRVLRPGGAIVLADADDGLTVFHPEPPGLTAVMRALEARQARAGGDRRVGRKLPGILGDAGFDQVGFHVLPFTSHGLGRGPFLDLVVSSRLLRIGTGEEPEVEEAAAGMLDDLARCEWHATACVVVAHGSRPRT
jgi:SAM-dependent methyltransferase